MTDYDESLDERFVACSECGEMSLVGEEIGEDDITCFKCLEEIYGEKK